MKRFILLFFYSTLISISYSQTMQATIKRGRDINTIDIYAKSSASFSQKDDGITLSLAIPANYSPAPVAIPGKTPNGTGPVTSISGIRPNFLVNNIGTTEREVVVNTETINGVLHYVYAFLFSGTATAEHSWEAGVEQLLASISWGGCTSANCLSSIKLVSLPNGGENIKQAYWYFQVSPSGDITNYTSPFYANPDALPPVSGGSTTALSLIELSTEISLPVKLVSFKGESGNCSATLSWDATEEAGFAYYAVERSNDGITFNEVKRFAVFANNTSIRSYHFTDEGSPAGTVFYRLRMADDGGRYEYSAVKPVTSNCDGKSTITVYPTLSSGVVHVKLPPGMEQAKLKMINTLGEEVAFNTEKSLNRTMSLKKFTNGTYIVRVINNNLIIKNIKVVLQQ